MRKGEISEFKKISPFLYYWQYCFLVEVIKMEKKSNTVKKKKTKRLDAKENFWGYVFLSPVIIGFLVFTVFPVVMSFYYRWEMDLYKRRNRSMGSRNSMT